MGRNLWINYSGVLSASVENKSDENQPKLMMDNQGRLFDDLAAAHQWFTRKHIVFAYQNLIFPHNNEKLNSPVIRPLNDKTLAFWLRPQLPFEGVELIIFAIWAGFQCVIRANETEKTIYQGILGLVTARYPEIDERIKFIDHPFGKVDAYVIVGERPAPSMLDYLKKKPVFLDTSGEYHSIAVVTGNESSEELNYLATDLCMYFGRSKFNIAELMVPVGYDFTDLLASVENYRDQVNHSRYFNHYEYRKAAYIVSGEAIIDNGFLLFIQGNHLDRHIGVVQYYEYKNNDLLKMNMKNRLVFKAKPDLEAGEQAFGSACGRGFYSVERFSEFIVKV